MNCLRLRLGQSARSASMSVAQPVIDPVPALPPDAGERGSDLEA